MLGAARRVVEHGPTEITNFDTTRTPLFSGVVLGVGTALVSLESIAVVTHKGVRSVVLSPLLLRYGSG